MILYYFVILRLILILKLFNIKLQIYLQIKVFFMNVYSYKNVTTSHAYV